jgi:hypothetical protein
MSAGDTIQAAIAFVSFCAFVGLIFSIRSLREATFASVYQGIADQRHDLDKLFVETPELRPHFYGTNKQLPDDERERERVLATAELIVDFADNFVAQSPLLPSRYDEQAYGRYFRDLYRRSLAIQRFWSESGDWYCDELRDLLTEGAPAPAPSTSESVPADAEPS